MGQHLADHRAAEAYARELLEKRTPLSNAVILEEKMTGIEFTLQAFTDGDAVLRVPASYDYPYRLVGDGGPGTGGMGAFTNREKALPFLTAREYEQSLALASKVVTALNREGRSFNGVLNVGFFLTDQGLRVTEFNARVGDPECVNLMVAIDESVSVTQMMRNISAGRLGQERIPSGRKRPS